MTGARAMGLTKSARASLAARLKEHSAADLTMMVEWVTGCRCRAPTCRACSYLQPGGYANPQTYLRPDNCATYIDLAARASTVTTAPTQAGTAQDWQHIRDVCTARDRREINGTDQRHTLTLKAAVRNLGGREAIAANLGHAESDWPRAWSAALDEIAAKLEAMR